LEPGEDGDEGGERVVVCARREVGYEVEVGFFVGERLVDCAAPEVVLLEESGVETGYDAEVVVAASEGPEKTRVAGAGRCYDGAVAEDDFVGLDVVAGEAIATGEEGDAT
jgi:hypothetical protein